MINTSKHELDGFVSFCRDLVLTLWSGLCCDQNGLEQIGKQCWIYQLQCPANRRTNISHST